MEKLGIPTTVIIREGFSQVVANGFSGLGFFGDAPSVFEFAGPLFVPGSDLSPLKENIDKIVYGLTKWEPKTKATGLITPPLATVAGKDYQEAVANMNNLFLRNNWGDGLPILPATEDRVSWILTGTDLSPDTVVAKIMPRGGIATVKMIAVTLAMTNGRPEYLPVLIAAVQGITDPELKHQEWSSTTGNTFPVVIVNGPIGKQIRLNSGYGCLGPDPAHPAGASIGRAIRFILMDMGGAVPGKGTMAIHGQPQRYTNMVFAEDEDGLPADWQPLNVELGMPRGTNSVATYCASGTTYSMGGETSTEEVATAALRMATLMMNGPMIAEGGYVPGFLVMARGTAQGLSALGWSKDKVKTYLWEHSKVPIADLKGTLIWWQFSPDLPDLSPISKSPGDIKIVVAGGEQSGHLTWIQEGWYGELTTATVKLPKNWDALLKQAETDLGPIPAR